ncbi:alpha-amylase [Thalassotalea sp. M1531]|uniref:Alpha-amylase n=1 Tax=Thalassotalea algicola TaxID=2716224 RepID=A0A7Y0L8P1_9GAMM|nr:alpha-amylase family glycosyl hydrolase [Thalassotalea algicola]NMP30000.1 alpha-amylase [Thalassotalea algicola]
MIKLTTVKKAVITSAIALALTACGDNSTTNSAKSATNKSTDNVTNPATEVTSVEQATGIEGSELAHYLTRDIQDEVFYFVLPDRFNNGNTENDNGSKTIAISQGGFDKTKKGHYHGGDVQGLTDKIPYLKEMGITSIWLTPILRNRSMQGDITGYHGYWVLDFTEIDPHLGSNADLKHFIDTAHANNIKVFFDIITNHTADVIRYKECHGDGEIVFSDGKQMCDYKSLAQVASGDKYTPFVPADSDNIKVPAWLNDPKYYHNQGDSTFSGENSVYGDFFGLDDINTDDQAVVDGMVDIFSDIISQFKPDGFRIDTVKHVNIEFWQQFAPALVKHANEQGLPNFFMFGEVFDGNPDVLSKFTTTGKMQSVLDFGFAFAIKDVLVDQKGTNQLANLFAQDHKYNDHDSNANQLLNFVGNHDLGRLAWMLSKSEHNYSEDEKLARLALAHSMMFFLRGVPVVYYGSEQGFVGDGGNHDSRQDMMPSLVPSYNDDVLVGTDKTTADDNFDKNHPLYQSLAEFAEIYQANKALRYGEQKVIYSSDEAGIFAITRTLASGEQQLVVFNVSNDMQQANLSFSSEIDSAIYDSGNTLTSNENDQLMVAMSPLSVAIYQVK